MTANVADRRGIPRNPIPCQLTEPEWSNGILFVNQPTVAELVDALEEDIAKQEARNGTRHPTQH